MHRIALTLLFYCWFSTFLIGQIGIIEGNIISGINREPLAYCNILVNENDFILSSDSSGSFSIELEPGYYNLEFSFLSFETIILRQVKVDPIKPNRLEIELFPSTLNLDEVVISTDGFNKTAETPHSIKNIGINEINRFPGATLDVSKIIKSLPGVLPKVSFGYNIIVRGGAASENKFYIDDIEIPTINHFTVQGISGGPNGMINVDLLRGADLISGAFPANRANALSSVLNMKTRAGRSDRIGGKFTLGATDVGLTIEGPVYQGNFIASYRKSFSEYYLKAFKLPILPEYSDYNFKYEIKWKNQEFKIIGIGGLNHSALNLDDANAENATQKLKYNTGYIPEGNQSIHTIGANYKRFNPTGYFQLVLSTSYWNNRAEKYFDNSYEPDQLWFKYNSKELNHRLNMEKANFLDVGTFKYGFSISSTSYSLDNYLIDINEINEPYSNIYFSEINALNYGAFLSFNSALFDQRLKYSIGLRSDGSSIGQKTVSPLNQISPRVSLSYNLTEKASINTNFGSYYQLPPVNVMAYFNEGQFLNKDKLKYINSRQFAFSFEYLMNQGRRFTIEAYFKNYSNYPFLLKDSISLANANADYVVVGNQSANSRGSGHAYGIEAFIQQKFLKNTIWSAVYNFGVSEFADQNDDKIPSSWDTRHFLSLIFTRTFAKTWQIGAKFTYASGSPYTPFDASRSSQIEFWNVNRRGIFDFSRLNQERLSDFHQMDLRLDKNFYFSKWTLNLYMDIQNIYSSPIEFIPYLVPQADNAGNYIIDPNNNDQYLMELVSSDSGRVLPTIGIIAEF